MSILGDPSSWPPDFNGYVFLGRVVEALSPDVVWAEFLSGKLELRAWATGAAKFQWVQAKTFRDSDRERALSTYQCETSGPQPYWLYVKRRSLLVFSLNNERKSVPNPAIPLSLCWRPDLEHLPHDGVVEQASSPSHATADTAPVTLSSPAPVQAEGDGGTAADGTLKEIKITSKKKAEAFVIRVLKNNPNATLDDVRETAKGKGDRRLVDDAYRLVQNDGKPMTRGPRSNSAK